MSKEVVRYLVKAGSECSEMVYASDYSTLLAERDALAERLAEARFSLDGMAELCRDARDERDAAQKDAERFREIVAAVVREHPHRSANRGNAPGHGHSVPGVWDSDNGALAGTECAWCKTWNEAIAALQGAQP